MPEKFQDSNALAAISRRLAADAAADGGSADPTGRRPPGALPQREPAPLALASRAAAAPTPPRPLPPPPPAKKRASAEATAPAPPPPLPPPAPGIPTASIVDALLAASSADPAALQASLVALTCSPRPLPPALAAVLARGGAALGRACPETLPTTAAIIAAELLAAVGGGVAGDTPAPPTDPYPTRLAAHAAAFADGLAALRRSGFDGALLGRSVAMLVGAEEE